MKRVTGIGGLFIKAKNPEAMYAWYREHLGMEVDPAAHVVDFSWKDSASGEDAHTYWSLFKESTKYFEPSKAAVMINYRVDDLNALVSGLKSEGVDVIGREDHEYGKFAWIMDPEGNKIELWEPPKAK
jgi:catechol 2,3-dioxygenase-like lactoylglutathione lyase family enzyme